MPRPSRSWRVIVPTPVAAGGLICTRFPMNVCSMPTVTRTSARGSVSPTCSVTRAVFRSRMATLRGFPGRAHLHQIEQIPGARQATDMRGGFDSRVRP